MSDFPTYHKIHSPWKRGDRGRFTDEWSRPEFGYLADADWLWSEKLDGTNIRVGWRRGETLAGMRVTVGGRTDRAQIRADLFDFLAEHFTEERLDAAFPAAELDGAGVVLYGEGIGPKIQKNGHRLSPEPTFVLFDVRVGRWWLRREDVADLAGQLDVQHAPARGCGTLAQAEAFVREGFPSALTTAEPGTPAEGLVLRPAVELLDRAGERVVTKMKTRDWR